MDYQQQQQQQQQQQLQPPASALTAHDEQDVVAIKQSLQSVQSYSLDLERIRAAMQKRHDARSKKEEETPTVVRF